MAEGNDYIEVSIAVGNDSDSKDILLAQLAEAGFEGFEEERNLLKAFIPKQQFDQQVLTEIIATRYRFSTSVIQYKNWNEEWESGFDPVIVEDFCGIRADFHQPIGNVAYEIIITPKMSFGTGHHATTYLMIDTMQHISFINKSVFDFGTGTGVLAILAEKMGAAEIEAIDIDEWSIENGKENLLRNESSRIHLYQSAEISGNKTYDVILANINRNVILQQLGAINTHLKPGGIVLLSGLLTGDEAVVTERASQNQLKLLSRKERNSWICLEFAKVQD